MNKLKLVCLTMIQLIKQIYQLPKTVAEAAAHRRVNALAKEKEIERLDRIRNPSKYAGR